MKVIFSFIAVLLLVLIAYTGVTVLNAQSLFGIVIPYLGVLLFIGGVIYRVLKWGSSPGTVPHPHDLRTTEIAPLDQAEQA